MSDAERQDWLNMKRMLGQYLPVLERQIIEFAADGDDEQYEFLIKKAVEYRNTIAAINDLLSNEQP